MAARLDDASIRIKIDPREAQNALDDMDKKVEEFSKAKGNRVGELMDKWEGVMTFGRNPTAVVGEKIKMAVEGISKKIVGDERMERAKRAAGVVGQTAEFFEKDVPQWAAALEGFFKKDGQDNSPGALRRVVDDLSQKLTNFRKEVESYSPAAKDAAQILRCREQLGATPPKEGEMLRLYGAFRRQRAEEEKFQTWVEKQREQENNYWYGRVFRNASGL